jgi:raffinose/stachyose/melibiose transport system substrate-binding protein
MNMNEKNHLNKKNTKLTRRDALKLFGLGLGSAALAGCTPKPTPGVVAPDPTTATDPIVQKSVKLRYQNHWSKETDAHYKGMQWLYKEFPAKYSHIEIQDILNPDSIESTKKIIADCAAGDCPDIVHGPSPDMWEAGYLLDLTPHINADSAWKNVLLESTFFATAGHVWGLCGEFSPMPVIWNTRLLDKAGVGDIPKTWDEFLTACDKIKSSGKIPTSWAVGGSHQWHNIVKSLEGGMEALGQNQFDAPQLREAFSRMKVFVDNKWIPDNEIEITWQQSVGFFVAEETAFFLNGAWTLNNEVRGEGSAPDLRDNVKFAPYPAVGKNGTTVELKKTTSIGLAASLAKDPDKLEAAITFLKFWFSAEGGKQWILLTQSPMGVNVDVNAIPGADPLLLDFLAPTEQADSNYSLPETVAMQERGWDDCWTGLQALMAGKGVDGAMAAFNTEMAKYK